MMPIIIHDFMRYNKNMARNLSGLLERSLSPAQLDFIRRVAVEAAAMKYPLYLVGGFVRDLVLARAGTDFDLVVEGDAIRLARHLVSRYGGKVTAHARFGTAKLNIKGWSLPGGTDPNGTALSTLDLIAARTEIYNHPAALPTVKMGTIADDLRRRDFTINALAIRLDGDGYGELRDELGGWEDLHKGLIRVLHARSFVEDPTRMYRAARYEQRYDFKIVTETLALIPESRALVGKLSAQRIRHELELLLQDALAADVLARLAQLDLLRPIHEALPWDKAVEFALSGCSTSRTCR